MKDINYYVGRYVKYGTLFAWIKWEKEQEHNPLYKNITSCNFCNKYLILDEYGNTQQFDESMNEKYKKEYEKRKYEKHKERSRENSKLRRNNNPQIKEDEKRERINHRHRKCVDPRYNKIIRDKSHKPYEEYTNYYNLYEWAKSKLKSENLTDVEKEILNGFSKAEDFAKHYLVTDENENYIIIKTQQRTKKKEDRFALCKDPRYGSEYNVTKYTTKIWDKQICTYNALLLHAKINMNFSSDKERITWCRQFILLDSNGNYVYDEQIALKILKSDNDETDLEQYSDYFQDSIFDMF